MLGHRRRRRRPPASRPAHSAESAEPASRAPSSPPSAPDAHPASHPAATSARPTARRGPGSTAAVSLPPVAFASTAARRGSTSSPSTPTSSPWAPGSTSGPIRTSGRARFSRLTPATRAAPRSCPDAASTSTTGADARRNSHGVAPLYAYRASRSPRPATRRHSRPTARCSSTSTTPPAPSGHSGPGCADTGVEIGGSGAGREAVKLAVKFIGKNARATSFEGFEPSSTQLAWCAWFLTNLWKQAGVKIPVSWWSGYPYQWASAAHPELVIKHPGRPAKTLKLPVGAALMYGTSAAPAQVST